MNRRAFVTGLGAVLAAPLAAGAQQAGKVWRIGQLVSSEPVGLDAFRQRLGELGYVEGQNLFIERRNAEGRTERLPALVAEFVQLRADVIVTIGTQAALAAKQGTTEIPIVMATSGDAVGAGLIRSLARPGGNVTGITGSSPELSRKRLELLREAFPKTVRVAVLSNPANALHVLEREKTVEAARTLHLKLQWVEAHTSDEIEAGFSAATKARADMVVIFPDPVFTTKRGQIASLAAKHRLPAMYAFREFTEAGGLMSYGANISDMLGRAATYVDKILQGAKPGDLPVEQPTKFELVINLKTAKALGLTIPPSVLQRADQIIE
jgi:putative tryptophan/tyrosine transport system substrate-binding protein